MDAELFMKAKITEKIFDFLFDVKAGSPDFSEVLRSYDISKKDLHDLLWEKLNISGMEVRIANTAVDFLICSCVEGKDLCDTIRK